MLNGSIIKCWNVRVVMLSISWIQISILIFEPTHLKTSLAEQIENNSAYPCSMLRTFFGWKILVDSQLFLSAQRRLLPDWVSAHVYQSSRCTYISRSTFSLRRWILNGHIRWTSNQVNVTLKKKKAEKKKIKGSVSPRFRGSGRKTESIFTILPF